MTLAQNSSAFYGQCSLHSSIRQQLQERINHAVPNIHTQENQRRSDRVVSISTGALQKGWNPLLAKRAACQFWKLTKS